MFTFLKLLLFVAAGAGILYISWDSFGDTRRHGFYRFFAFWAILGILMLNMSRWFYNPFSGAQMLSWILLFISLFLVVHGFYLLRIIGKPAGNIEQTTQMVAIGAYKYIRHPLYASLLYLAWGGFLKGPGGLTFLLVAAATLFLYLTAKAEEMENLQKFGLDYADYMHRTKMFIPFLL